MIKPANIMDSLVALLRGIPELIEAMDGDEERIYFYDDTYPMGVNFHRALQQLPSPGIMVRYRSISESQAGWKFAHNLTLYARPKVEASYSNLIYSILTGIPEGQTFALIDMSICDGLNPLRIEGEFAPQVDEEGVEYLEMNIRLEEN
jgi:hypothetical protein